MPPKAPTSIPSKSADAIGLLLGEGGGGLWEGLGSGPSWHRAGVGESQLPGALFPTGFCSLEEVTSLPECPSVSSKQPPGHGCWGGAEAGRHRVGDRGWGELKCRVVAWVLFSRCSDSLPNQLSQVGFSGATSALQTLCCFQRSNKNPPTQHPLAGASGGLDWM